MFEVAKVSKSAREVAPFLNTEDSYKFTQDVRGPLEEGLEEAAKLCTSKEVPLESFKRGLVCATGWYEQLQAEDKPELLEQVDTMLNELAARLQKKVRQSYAPLARAAYRARRAS